MDWLASGRLHPIDQLFSKACVVPPLLLLGFEKATFGGYQIFSAICAIVIHANVRWTFGPLRHVIGTPQFHHWHHANVPEAIDTNFAGQLPVLDRIFGTHHLPGNEWPGAYGIDESIPPTYIGQLRWSFTHPAPPR
jgi:sterol desaturase/sphingolipid hydroxylase (fatty acid hydroxylase superfamily)